MNDDITSVLRVRFWHYVYVTEEWYNYVKIINLLNNILLFMNSHFFSISLYTYSDVLKVKRIAW